MAKILIFLLASLALITGCTAIGTGLKQFDTGIVDETTISEALEANYSDIRTVSGSFDFSYTTSSDKQQSSGYIYLSKNDTVYLEIKGLVGETEAVLFMNKDSLKAVNYFNKILVKGARDENSINRITGLNISVTDLKTSLFCYDRNPYPVNIVRREADRIVIRVSLTDKKYQFVTLNKNLLITEIDEYYERDLVYKKEYDYFISSNGHIMPKRIRLRTYNPPSKLTIFYTEIDINALPKEFSEVSL